MSQLPASRRRGAIHLFDAALLLRGVCRKPPGHDAHARVRSNDAVDRSGDSSLVRRIAAAPQLQAADEARARVNDWLAEIAGASAGKTLTRLSAAHPRLDALMTGLAGGSPYLWDLVRGSPERFVALLEAEPERRFCDVLADARRAVAATCDEAEVMRLLRRMRAEASLLIALADIGGVWPVTRVIAALTELADAAVAAAVRHLLGQAAREGKLKPTDHAEPEAGSGYIVLAMGKMGAGELNYSS